MSDNRSTIRSLFLHNKRLKGLSFVLGVITWYLIQDAISFELKVPNVRLDVRVPGGMAILNQSVATVDVTLRGSQDDIQLQDPRRLEAIIELPERQGPSVPREVTITPSMIHGLRGARVVEVYPERVQIALDRQELKWVPVKGRITGLPLAGRVESVECEPTRVLLRGPAAKLRTTELVYTQPVDVDGRVESFVKRVSLQAPGENWTADMDPPDVQVRVAISGKDSN